ncbi:8515_t:CDS:2 [Entrophospora sp. SA101]|nr:8515_t:CDS:2 [Entrophospora sp. SA101]
MYGFVPENFCSENSISSSSIIQLISVFLYGGLKDKNPTQWSIPIISINLIEP